MVVGDRAVFPRFHRSLSLRLCGSLHARIHWRARCDQRGHGAPGGGQMAGSRPFGLTITEGGARYPGSQPGQGGEDAGELGEAQQDVGELSPMRPR